jgi:uncharacterized protein (DUF1501 family)
MLSLETRTGISDCRGVSRRDFLRVGALAAGSLTLGLPELAAAPTTSREPLRCIWINLLGGPSQLETWDPKPDAPEAIRGPFRAMATNVPGIQISEHFPKMARMAQRYTLVRSLYHDAAPIHETGLQLLQTGQLAEDGIDHPHLGAELPAWAMLPGPIYNTGVSVSHGQTAGYKGDAYEAARLPGSAAQALWRLNDLKAKHGLDPARLENKYALLDSVDEVQRAYEQALARDGKEIAGLETIFSPQAKQAFSLESESNCVRARYGWTTFGQSCLLARRLVERNVRLVTVNMFDTVYNALSWDCHADGGQLNVRLEDYASKLCPMFDQAFTALLYDLHQRGLLEKTLVVATGEFGRTPRLNLRGGRDHWPHVWTAILAGGGIPGGQVLGSSDAHGAEPKDQPLHARELHALVRERLGIPRCSEALVGC